jgi:hypothetical protein
MTLDQTSQKCEILFSSSSTSLNLENDFKCSTNVSENGCDESVMKVDLWTEF